MSDTDLQWEDLDVEQSSMKVSLQACKARCPIKNTEYMLIGRAASHKLTIELFIDGANLSHSETLETDTDDPGIKEQLTRYMEKLKWVTECIREGTIQGNHRVTPKE